jgi:hypothetical protein
MDPYLDSHSHVQPHSDGYSELFADGNLHPNGNTFLNQYGNPDLVLH